MRKYRVSVCWICYVSSRTQVGVRVIRNIWVSLALIVGMTYFYFEGRRIVIWLKDRIYNLREVTTVNNVNNLKSVNPS